MSDTRKKKPNRRLVLVADEKAVVAVLEALAPLSLESRALVMQTVEANLQAGYPHLRSVGNRQPTWREVNDPLTDFLSDCCRTGKDLTMLRSDLSRAYADWCNAGAERFPLGRSAFFERLASLGFESKNRRDGILTGIALKKRGAK